MDVSMMLGLRELVPRTFISPPKLKHRREAASLLPGNMEQIAANAIEEMDILVNQAVMAQNESEFRRTVEQVFPKYLRIAYGLSLLLTECVSRELIASLRLNGFTSIERRLEEEALAAFGGDVQRQALFTAWTLRKISDTCTEIDDASLPEDCAQEDRQIYERFVFHTMHTRFILDCLLQSMARRIPFHPRVLPRIVEGLRHAVNAYAYARRALDLRVPMPTMSGELVNWDEEDMALLEEAARDFPHEVE